MFFQGHPHHLTPRCLQIVPGHPFVPPTTIVPSAVQHKALQVGVQPFRPSHTGPMVQIRSINFVLFSAARNSDSKWSPGTVTNTSLAHELWKVPLPSKGISAPSRPPPGLTGQKQPSSWDNGSLRLAGWGSSDSRFNSG